jgi:hypothetical protein
MDNQNQIILYQDDNDITRVSVHFADEDLWLTQNQLAEIYCMTRENVTMHINNIYADGELTKISTSKDFLLVRQEGNRQEQRNIAHYNLDMIIALDYRVQTQKHYLLKCLDNVSGLISTPVMVLMASTNAE